MNDTEMSASRVPGTFATVSAETDSDNKLIEQYLHGDAHAFEILFKRYQSPVFNMVSRMVSAEDAYDLTQDVFCNVLRALPGFRGESKFSTWLYSIARNVCLNRIRHRSCLREQSLESISEEQPYVEFQDTSVDIETIVETHELQRMVNAILETLPPEQRLLITLRDFQQLSYEEIGLITGLSQSNVKSRLHRARMAFRDKFRPHMALLREGR